MSINKAVSFFFLLGVTIISSCSSKSEKNGFKTQIAVNQKIKNFGLIDKQLETEAVFFIRNIGESDLIINDVKADCHCTIPEWNENKIASGDSTRIVVIYRNFTGTG